MIREFETPPEPGEAVTLDEIAHRLHYSLNTVRKWTTHPHLWCPHFPAPTWRRHEPRKEFVWDWRVVADWYQETHPHVVSLRRG